MFLPPPKRDKERNLVGWKDLYAFVLPIFDSVWFIIVTTVHIHYLHFECIICFSLHISVFVTDFICMILSVMIQEMMGVIMPQKLHQRALKQ